MHACWLFYMTRYPRPRPRTMTAQSKIPYLCFSFMLSPALVVSRAGDEDVPLELLLDSVEEPEDVPVVTVALEALETLEALEAVEAAEAAVLLEAKVLIVDEVSIRTPPEEVLLAAALAEELGAEAELETELAATELALPLALLPELAPQVPLDLMLCQSPVMSE